VNTIRAFAVGVIGTVIMSLVMICLRAIDVPLHIEHRLGEAVGRGAWVPGLIVYLIIGGILALAYAAIFEWVLHQAGVGPGLLLGACNAVFAGFFWAQLNGPGPFWDRLGAEGIGALFLVHFVYGATVGGLYRTRHTLAYF
jgi:hypothetical protein